MPIVTIGGNTTDTFTGVEDTFLSSSEPTTNKSTLGDIGVSKFAVGEHGHGIVRFPGLSNIPSGSVVTEARINLTILFASISAGYAITAKRILRSAVISEMTWNIYSTAGGAWQTAGGLGALDRSSTVLATVALAGTEGFEDVVVLTGANLAQAVEDVINGVTSDLIIHLERTDGADDEEFIGFASSEEGTDGLLPFLYVDYTDDVPTTTTRVAQDELVVVDSFISSTRRMREMLDLVVITEGPLDRFTVFQANAAEAFELNDFSSRWFVRGRVAADTIALNDAIIKLLQFTAIMTDILITTETSLYSTIHQALASDALVVMDEYIRRLLITRMGEDSTIIIDNFLTSTTGQQIIAAIAEDVIVISWQTFTDLYRNRESSDSSVVTDVNGMNLIRSVMVSSSIELVDEMLAQFIRVVSLSDSMNLIDSVSALFFGTVVVNPTAIRIGVDQPMIVLGGYAV